MARTILRSKRSRDGQVASVWENMGMLEETVYQREEQWAGEVQKFREMEQALEIGGLRTLNKPNLLKQNWWTNRNMPSSAVIVHEYTVPAEDATAAASPLTFTVSNSAITTAYVLHGKWSENYTIVPYDQITASIAAGAATVTIGARSGAHGAEVLVKVALCTVANTIVPYGNASRISGTTYPYLDSIRTGFYPGDDSEDGCSVSVATLTGDNIINELDGEVYDKALQFSITANSAWGNAEELHFCQPNERNVYEQGKACWDYGQIPELVPGETYTIGFWGRMISGDKAWARCSWGGVNYRGMHIWNSEGRCGVSDWIEISGAQWTRYSWRFRFQPEGDWYTESSAEVDGVTKITRTYNWFKKVAVGVSRKYSGVLQLCGFRLVPGRLWVTDTWDDLGDKIDQYTDHIDDLDNEVAKKADKAKTELTGPVSMGRKTGSPAGVRSLAMGDDAVAGGKGSAAQGIGVVTYTDGGRAFGSYNAVPTRNVANYAVAHEYVVGDYARYEEDVLDPVTEQIIPEDSTVEIYRCLVAHTSVDDWPETDKWQRVARFTLAEYSGNSVPADLLEAVGNGTGDGARSNARTLDRNGNETLAGKLTLGAAPSGNMDAATKAYVDGAGSAVTVNLGTVDLGNGFVWFYPPFAASKYRPVELILSNTDGISAVKVKTGKTIAEYIYLNATIKNTPGVMCNYSKDVTLKLEKIEKTYTLGRTAWSEAGVNGATVDFTY